MGARCSVHLQVTWKRVIMLCYPQSLPLTIKENTVQVALLPGNTLVGGSFFPKSRNTPTPVVPPAHLACRAPLPGPRWSTRSGLHRAQSASLPALPGWHVYRNPNGKDLPLWPVFDQEEQYLQLNTQPAVSRALKSHRLQFWMKTLPQKMQELMEAEKKHTEL